MTKPNTSERFQAGKEIARLSAQIKSTLSEITRDFKAGDLVDTSRFGDTLKRLNEMQTLVNHHDNQLRRERRMVVKKEN